MPNKNVKTVEGKPFALSSTLVAGGFMLSFRCLAADGEVLVVNLEFPLWWVDHIMLKLRGVG